MQARTHTHSHKNTHINSHPDKTNVLEHSIQTNLALKIFSKFSEFPNYGGQAEMLQFGKGKKKRKRKEKSAEKVWGERKGRREEAPRCLPELLPAVSVQHDANNRRLQHRSPHSEHAHLFIPLPVTANTLTRICLGCMILVSINDIS